jgi:hypothetical protein
MERLKVIEINGVEYLVAEETVPEPVEFRLYYNEDGSVKHYTCEKLEGAYIVIDQQTYGEMRMDVRVKDGKITKVVPGMIISKLKPDDNLGTATAISDISMVVADDQIEKQKWKLHTHEL